MIDELENGLTGEMTRAEDKQTFEVTDPNNKIDSQGKNPDEIHFAHTAKDLQNYVLSKRNPNTKTIFKN